MPTNFYRRMIDADVGIRQVDAKQIQPGFSAFCEARHDRLMVCYRHPKDKATVAIAIMETAKAGIMVGRIVIRKVTLCGLMNKRPFLAEVEHEQRKTNL